MAAAFVATAIAFFFYGPLLGQSTPIVADECPALLKAAGASERFPGIVAHGVHSLTVEALRLFEPTVTEHNRIPVVNTKLQDPNAILRNAPSSRPSPFTTNWMRAVDEVLSHSEDASYGIKGYTSLEKVVHALHMEEVWQRAKAQYDKIALSPPAANVCACATDVERNGVMKMLRFIALQIREPSLMYGQHTVIDGREFKWEANVYHYANFALAPKDADDVLLNPADSIPTLNDGEAGWAAWKKLMVSTPAAHDRELALYLYCALHAKPNKM